MQITEEMGVHKEWYEQADKQTMETLSDFINHLIKDYEHDYGTICHALTAGALATCWSMNRTDQGGITGFQASAIMWEFIRNWGFDHKDSPLRLVNFKHMLFPQYEDDFEKTISAETAEWLVTESKKMLEESEHASDNVIAHWKKLSEGHIPFGYSVRQD